MANHDPRLTVYFSQEEIDRIKELAKKDYMNASSWVRKKIAPIAERETAKLKAKQVAQ